jgi:hypothetical protein
MNALPKAALALPLLGLLTAYPAHADSTNFTYTTLSAGLVKITLKDQTCVAGECYKELGAINFGGAYQFASDWLVASIGVQGGGNSGPTTKISSSSTALGLSVVKALGDRVDVQAGVASLSTTAESCVGSFCVKIDDSGVLYSAGLNAWLDKAQSFAGHLAVNSSKYSRSTKTHTATLLGLSYYPGKNHEFAFSFSSDDSSTTANLGYAYHF